MRRTSHALLSCSKNARDAREQFEGWLHAVCADQRTGRADLADGELHPQFTGLMLDYEQKFVVRIGQRRLRAEQFGKSKVVAI